MLSSGKPQELPHPSAKCPPPHKSPQEQYPLVTEPCWEKQCSTEGPQPPYILSSAPAPHTPTFNAGGGRENNHPHPGPELGTKVKAGSGAEWGLAAFLMSVRM